MLWMERKLLSSHEVYALLQCLNTWKDSQIALALVPYCIATTICSRHASQALILNKFLAMSHSRGHCEQAPEQCVTEKCQIWIF